MRNRNTQAKESTMKRSHSAVASTTTASTTTRSLPQHAKLAIMLVALLLVCVPLATAQQFPSQAFTPPPIPSVPPIPKFLFPTTPPTTKRPVVQPTLPPTARPIAPPSNQPTRQPTRRPTRQPTSRPVGQPTPKPTLEDRQETFGPVAGIPVDTTLPPSPRPTLRPTQAPTRTPTLAPTPLPTRAPTRQPTRRPSPRPTAGPTSLPTRAPSPGPTPRPTPLPTQRPSRAPTRAPTNFPTRRPTVGPSAAPTFPPTPGPTPRPTVGPTRVPTQRPTARPSKTPSAGPTNVASAEPSAAPTPKTFEPTISPEPTPQPSQFPSVAPSAAPSNRPSVTPSVPPTDAPSLMPSSFPTLSLQQDLINVVMFVEETRGILENRSPIDWEAATAAHIRQSISNTEFGDEPIFDLAVRTNIIRQIPVVDGFDFLEDGVVGTAVPTGGPTSAPLVRRAARVLQQDDLLALQIVFVVDVSFRSVEQDYSAVIMVGDAFNSDEDRSAYVSRLQQTNNPDFDDVTRVTVLVEGQEIDEETTGGGGSSSTAAIAGAAAGASLVVILTVVLILRRRSSGSKSNGPNTASVSDLRMGVSTEIMVQRGQDDISTLGDPMYGPGGMVMGETRDERTASVGDDYDYAKDYLAKPVGGPPSVSVGSRSRITSADSGRGSKVSLGPMANAVFSDEDSFEQQYSADEDRFDVSVPPGKLGMVIDTPNGGVPVVHAIKSESILSSRVKVGDKLVAVDHEDVTSMTAVQVSKMISLKSDQKRVLSFVRAHAPDSGAH